MRRGKGVDGRAGPGNGSFLHREFWTELLLRGDVEERSVREAGEWWERCASKRAGHRRSKCVGADVSWTLLPVSGESCFGAVHNFRRAFHLPGVRGRMGP
ncbi:hypothetical protein GCM10017597_33250 [Brachybacterium conglomeratum]|nr:hypothetical protein GCM10017597_33250 [Brachybacterium conglomeratum]